MKCISWNVRGLQDERRRGIVGCYLREWGADIICLQETMLASSSSDLGRHSDGEAGQLMSLLRHLEDPGASC